MEAVEKARSELVGALRDKATKYWELLKLWYKRKISKDDFDLKAKAILGEEGVHLHNEFLFAILVKCQTPDGSSVSELRQDKGHAIAHPIKIAEDSSKSEKRMRLESDITPYGVLDDFAYGVPTVTKMYGKDLDQLLLCSHELLLPDLPTLHIRMLLIAWEAGVENVSQDSAQYMLIAVEYFLKNVIQACINNQRRHNESHHIRQSLSLNGTSHQRTSNVIEALDAQYTSLSSVENSSQLITPFHIRDIIQYGRPLCIPNHFVYHSMAERTLATMWHPCKKELASRRSVEEWQKHLND